MEEERFNEIRFYNYIKRLFDKYERGTKILDIINMYCSISDVPTARMRRLVQLVYNKDLSFSPTSYEQIFYYHKFGFSYRSTQKETGFSLTKQTRIMRDMTNDHRLLPHIRRVLPDEDYKDMIKLLDAIKKFREVSYENTN